MADISPAPWYVNAQLNVSDFTGKLVAVVDGEDEALALSNAQMMAASPAMYSALRNVKFLLENRPESEHKKVMMRIINCALEDVEKPLGKIGKSRPETQPIMP